VSPWVGVNGEGLFLGLISVADVRPSGGVLMAVGFFLV
jgi:hypothetical protein